jgi:hypothetical protein
MISEYVGIFWTRSLFQGSPRKVDHLRRAEPDDNKTELSRCLTQQKSFAMNERTKSRGFCLACPQFAERLSSSDCWLYSLDHMALISGPKRAMFASIIHVHADPFQFNQKAPEIAWEATFLRALVSPQDVDDDGR